MADGVPQDWRDLLIRLDQRVSDGFETMNKRFDAYDRRADALERRVGDLETMLADRPLYIGQHMGLVMKVAELERSRDKLDTMANTMKFVLGGGFATIIATIIGFAKSFGAI